MNSWHATEPAPPDSHPGQAHRASAERQTTACCRRSRLSAFPRTACRGAWWRSIRNRFSGAPKRSTGKCSACFAPAGHLFQWSVGRLRQAPSANAARVAGVWDRPGLETSSVRGLALAVSLFARPLSTWDSRNIPLPVGRGGNERSVGVCSSTSGMRVARGDSIQGFIRIRRLR
jgi:hypothetical protein